MSNLFPVVNTSSTTGLFEYLEDTWTDLHKNANAIKSCSKYSADYQGYCVSTYSALALFQAAAGSYIYTTGFIEMFNSRDKAFVGFLKGVFGTILCESSDCPAKAKVAAAFAGFVAAIITAGFQNPNPPPLRGRIR